MKSSTTQKEASLSKHLQQMGLTPAIRERVTMTLPKADDPFAQFFEPKEDDQFGKLMASR